MNSTCEVLEMRSKKATATTDHDEIRRWAEERGATPACVRSTGNRNDVGIIRLDFPGYSGEQSLEPIDWNTWFQKFDEQGLALLHQETTANGQTSNFNKLVSRETAESSNRASAGRQASATKARSTAKAAFWDKAASRNVRRRSQFGGQDRPKTSQDNEHLT
jgi:hypothetical protein